MSMDLLSVEMLLCFCIIPFKRTEELFTELEATDSSNCAFYSHMGWWNEEPPIQSTSLPLTEREYQPGV